MNEKNYDPILRDRTISIYEFLRTHELINLRKLERAAGLSKSFIYKYKAEGRAIPEKRLDAIEGVLVNYGYKGVLNSRMIQNRTEK